MHFKDWLLQIGKSERSAKSYSGAISGAISDWAQQANLTQQNLSEINRIGEFSVLAEVIKQLEIFIEKDTKGKGMYKAALKHYAAFLEDVCEDCVKDDIERVLVDKAIGETEKSQLVNARLGQGKFRNQLIDQWQSCALTGYPDTRFLVASHIKPWRTANNTERLDRYNGLLLLPNLDKVFDLGFITFESKGNIVISRHLERFSQLGLSKDMTLDLQEEHQDYLSYHRDVVFERSVY